MPKDSEFRIYPYIEKSLRSLGWDTVNPARGGRVYAQKEFYKHDAYLTDSLELDTPEYTVLISTVGGYRYWTIEAKSSSNDLDKSIREAIEYANKINAVHPNMARFATGVAGTTEESIYVRTCYWNGSNWTEIKINDYESTGLLSEDQCQHILKENNSQVAEFELNTSTFLEKATEINKTFHDNEIPVKERAQIMASLLLALVKDGNLRILSEPKQLMREINGNISDLLEQHGKKEFADTIQLVLPATEKNHYKYRKAIVEVLQHLRDMNIRSAINSSDDALGQFYETFLKYANGAKEMGIVLTPRHITKFAVDVVGISPDDRVFDPTCGTGGFLVSAMDVVRRNFQENAPKRYERFKEQGIFGVEQRDDVYGLALVNMIFRGDGKSNVFDGNCFDHQFWMRDQQVFYTLPNTDDPDPAYRPFNKVLMNPPFKLASAREDKFVNYALNQTCPRGLLFAVLPKVVIGGSSFSSWRKELLKRHTVEAVISFDKNLFYPVAESTYGLIIRAHMPHHSKNKVFMGVLFDDKHRLRRSKLISEHEAVDNMERMTKELKRFISGKPLEETEIPREQITTPLKIDENCDLSTEAYLPNRIPEKINIITRASAFHSACNEARMKKVNPNVNIEDHINLKPYPLLEFIEDTITPPLKSLKKFKKGNFPVVSATATNNGITEWKNIPEDLLLRDCITVSKTHNTKPCEAFWHPYEFSAINTVHILKPTSLFDGNDYALIYLCQSITQDNSWRYDYARTVQIDELEVYLPTIDGGGGRRRYDGENSEEAIGQKMNKPKQPTSIPERLVKKSGFGVFESSNYSESKTNPQ